MRNELNEGVAPEVIQALVEHCCETGNPDKVERCVLRMDIASLDLNQVLVCLPSNFDSNPVSAVMSRAGFILVIFFISPVLVLLAS